MPTRIAFAAAARAGAVQMLEDYKTAAGIGLQIYPARPRSIAPPTAFIDGMNERLVDFAGTIRQRTPTVHVVVVHGSIDDLEAATQRDAFVDGFLDWVADNFHAFDPRTLVAVTEVTDLPGWVPEWFPPQNQRTYYATQITLEGFAAT